MNTKTDAMRSDASGTASCTQGKKPRFAIFVATAGGLGYFPKAPGTFGSLAGLLLAVAPMWIFYVVTYAYAVARHTNGTFYWKQSWPWADPFLLTQIALTILIALVGTWAASRAAAYWGQKDPQRVVIDEVSGQHLTLLLGCAVPIWWKQSGPTTNHFSMGMISSSSPLNWKYLLLGFVLFRLFDIWKPSPAREAESLPGGWGIMADDWVAGIYAAIGLWLARAAGL
jgi:phosphatidylglycerophosphatase A